MSGDDPYLYPGTFVLKNKLGIMNAAELASVERLLVTQRAAEGTPQGHFDLAHLKAIHRHLFQDVYDRAGAIRTVELNKGANNSNFANTSKPAWRTCIDASRQAHTGNYTAMAEEIGRAAGGAA